MTLRCILSTLRKESISNALRFAFEIAGYVELDPRNSHLKEEGRGFNSTSGARILSKERLSSVSKYSTLTRVGRTCGEAS